MICVAQPSHACVQFITFGFACTPLYFVWEKLIGVHETGSVALRAAARLPIVVPIWFLAIIFPFFGPINSTVGSLLVSFTVYIIPALAHMATFAPPAARENAVERPPRGIGSWAGMYAANCFVVAWVLVVGFGFGGWASTVNFVRQVDTFGLFTRTGGRTCMHTWSGPPFCPTKKVATTVERSTGTDSVWLHVGKPQFRLQRRFRTKQVVPLMWLHDGLWRLGSMLRNLGELI
ncbi:unnamed protein product [Miscanthus lutarioriparius]|uniref:Amino acid transporter transmembrane domain-containing protein n=1 Tax=Miscanthus lutarioriparius TaxID=422564 RepID=A0A811Q6D2_9POAL|nr:unnamed protein product [Miscanthus lutarioriparius]